MEDPLDSEVSFDIKEIESEDKCKPGITTVSEVMEGDTNAVVNVCGRITFRGSEETVLSKGKTLRKQGALFTDEEKTVMLKACQTQTKSNALRKEFHLFSAFLPAKSAKRN